MMSIDKNQTSKIIKDYFNDMEISVLEQRTRYGEIINKMTENQQISFITKDNFEKMQQIDQSKEETRNQKQKETQAREDDGKR